MIDPWKPFVFPGDDYLGMARRLSDQAKTDPRAKRVVEMLSRGPAMLETPLTSKRGFKPTMLNGRN